MPARWPGVCFSSVQCGCETIFSSRNAAGLIACNAHRDAHAPADAQRGEALPGIALLHFMQQRHQHARAGCADRMADRDRATALWLSFAGFHASAMRAIIACRRCVRMVSSTSRLIDGRAYMPFPSKHTAALLG